MDGFENGGKALARTGNYSETGKEKTAPRRSAVYDRHSNQRLEECYPGHMETVAAAM